MILIRPIVLLINDCKHTFDLYVKELFYILSDVI